jgi:hypothetical protein
MVCIVMESMSNTMIIDYGTESTLSLIEQSSNGPYEPCHHDTSIYIYIYYLVCNAMEFIFKTMLIKIRYMYVHVMVTMYVPCFIAAAALELQSLHYSYGNALYFLCRNC